MGLLRRPTPGEKEEDGRFSRPYRPDALSRVIEKTNLRLRRHSCFLATLSTTTVALAALTVTRPPLVTCVSGRRGTLRRCRVVEVPEAVAQESVDELIRAAGAAQHPLGHHFQERFIAATIVDYRSGLVHRLGLTFLLGWTGNGAHGHPGATSEASAGT
jgi:hypothetical protein